VDVDDVSITFQARSRRYARFGALAVAMSVLAQGACDGSPPTDSDPLEGADLVAGTSLPRHGLLVIPRDGGPAELRAIEDPGRIRWSGTEELPATTAVHPLGRAVALRARDGAITVFHPSGELRRSAGSVPADARWVQSTDGGAFVWGTRALVLTGDETRSIASTATVTWAAPATGGRSLLLTVTEDGPRLEVWEADGDEPASVHPVSSRGPALLTGWGRELVLPEGDDGRTLVGRALPDLEPVEHARLDRAPVVLASSPSQHRLLAVSAGESRLESIDRYAWRAVDETSFDETVREVRPGVTGAVVLAFDGAQIWAILAGDGGREEIGSDWRTDLPIGLPGGRVLGTIGGAMMLFDLRGGGSVEVDGPTDAWWVPVRWTPRRVEPVVQAPELALEEGEDAEVDAAGAQLLNIGLRTVGRVAGRAVATTAIPEFEFRDETESGAEAPGRDRFTAIPDGFYAVASSSRQLENLGRLRSALERAGYRTEVLSRRDEANDLWYRLMVGPYPSRSDAEEAARSLQRERGISAWIHEAIGFGGPR